MPNPATVRHAAFGGVQVSKCEKRPQMAALLTQDKCLGSVRRTLGSLVTTTLDMAEGDAALGQVVR